MKTVPETLAALRSALSTLRSAERVLGPSPTGPEFTEAEGAEAYALVSEIAGLTLGLVGDGLSVYDEPTGDEATGRARSVDPSDVLEALENAARENRDFAASERAAGRS